MELLQTNEKTVKNLISEVIGFERIGDYEKAFESLRPFYAEIGDMPDVSELALSLAGEILLRCGSIVGFLGNLKQIPNAQEHSKNLLSAARSKFTEIYKPEKIAECENYLALSYYRKGEYNEAAVWADEALSRTLDNRNEVRLYSHIIKAMILLAESKFDDVILYLNAVSDHFEDADFFLRGCYCTNLSLACKNIGELDKALKLLNFARFCHQKSKHGLYLATVENNLAQLYKLRGEFSDALKSADNTIRLFKKMNDTRRIAWGMDTKAQVLIAKGDYGEAVELASKAIEILKHGENFGMLSEIYLTRAIAFLNLGNVTETQRSMVEAVKLAEQNGEAQANRIFESFETAWLSKYPPKIEKVFTEHEKKSLSENDIEIDLPRGVSPNQKFFGIWIKNDHFKKLGLEKGVMAIVVQTEVKKGDLAAINDTTSDLVTVGFFEQEFGLVALENPNTEPELFSEDRIKILGKVIGYCEPELNAKGRYTVKPIFLA